jgi:anti-sigma B factor antagonist
MDDFSTDVQARGDWTIVSVTGEIDAYTAPALQSAIAPQVTPGVGLVLDLSEVRFIDSTGLRVLVETLRLVREADGVLKLVTKSDQTLKLLRITALDKVFDVQTTLELATA